MESWIAWTATVSLAIAVIYLLKHFGIIDFKTSFLASLAAIAAGVLGKLSSGSSTNTGETDSSSEDPRDEDVESIDVKDRIKTAEEIREQVENANTPGDTGDGSGDVFDRANTPDDD